MADGNCLGSRGAEHRGKKLLGIGKPADLQRELTRVAGYLDGKRRFGRHASPGRERSGRVAICLLTPRQGGTRFPRSHPQTNASSIVRADPWPNDNLPQPSLAGLAGGRTAAARRTRSRRPRVRARRHSRSARSMGGIRAFLSPASRRAHPRAAESPRLRGRILQHTSRREGGPRSKVSVAVQSILNEWNGPGPDSALFCQPGTLRCSGRRAG